MTDSSSFDREEVFRYFRKKLKIKILFRRILRAY
jgi:hypothetical protein